MTYYRSGRGPTAKYYRQNHDNPYGDVINKHRGNAVVAGVVLLVFVVIPGVLALSYALAHH